MNKLILPALLVALSGSANAASRTEAEKEAYQLKAYRANPRDPQALVDVALIREGRSKWRAAFDAWTIVLNQHGDQPSTAFDGRRRWNHRQLAEWWFTRLSARQERQRKPNATQRAAIERHWKRIKNSSSFEQPGRVDLDNDSIPEIFYFISSYNSKGDTIRQLRVDKWEGNQYKDAWSSGDMVPESYTIIATKNWPRVTVTYIDGINTRFKSIYSNSEAIVEIED